MDEPGCAGGHDWLYQHSERKLVFAAKLLLAISFIILINALLTSGVPVVKGFHSVTDFGAEEEA